jgi:hypothetical protein
MFHETRSRPEGITIREVWNIGIHETEIGIGRVSNSPRNHIMSPTLRAKR